MYYINKRTEDYYIRIVIMFLISVFAAITTVLLMIDTYSKAAAQLKSPIPFESVMSDETEEGKVAYIDIVSQPVRAVDIKTGHYGGRQYYIVSDGKNNYAAIMFGTDARAAGDEAIQTGSFRLIGCTAAMSEKTRTKINEAVPEAIGSSQLLELHVLATYDTYHVVIEGRIFIWFISIFLAAFVMAVICIAYMISFYAGRANQDEKFEIEAEINASDTLWLENIRCYACKNWLVGLGKGFKAIRYTDIAKLYRKEITYKTLKISEELIALDKNGRSVTVTLFPITKLEKGKKQSITAELDALRLVADKVNKDIIYDIDKS